MVALPVLTGLAGCDLAVPDSGPAPMPQPALIAPDPTPDPVAVAPSALSRSVAEYYQGVQEGLLMQGLLRTDRGGPDTPFTDRNLAENFLTVALYDEYADDGSALVQQQTESRLRRWQKPVRVAVEFGASVPLAQRGRDMGDIARYVAELARDTGHPVSMETVAPNLTVLVLNEDERLAIAPRLRQLVPGISDLDLATITNMPRQTYCLVFAYSRGEASTYDRAVAVIRGEHPDLLRQSCIHEELAQGLGLANDSPVARPSIFNDDEEFALLTRQDALMLKMLYDPRLRPGMTLDQARPIAQAIATELVGGDS